MNKKTSRSPIFPGEVLLDTRKLNVFLLRMSQKKKLEFGVFYNKLLLLWERVKRSRFVRVLVKTVGEKMAYIEHIGATACVPSDCLKKARYS